MIPFSVRFEAGTPLCDQVVYAAKKAIVGGQMRAGDPFPSVRALSRALKVNPNTAHKVITMLLGEGLLEVRPGIGTVVAVPASTASDRGQLLKRELEQLVVEAKKLGVTLEEARHALETHWNVFDRSPYESRRKP